MADRDIIDHVIVLMLENRSFDHMFGYLDHVDPDVGVLRRNPQFCPVDPNKPDGPRTSTTPDADHSLNVDPAHSHEEVKRQIGLVNGRDDPDMSGFISSYQRRAQDSPDVQGPDIMRCFDERKLSVLATLAKEYAVFTRWFASVPGETWPNRNFAHAGTSAGTVDIKKHFYSNDTIFERLDEARSQTTQKPRWAIYHDGIPQVWVFHRLWRTSREPFKPIASLLESIRQSDLPEYSFIEPDHGFGLGPGNSQHPSNNRDSGESFVGGERLIGTIYNELARNEELFERTLFLITYDEHGGFFDHVIPARVSAPDTAREETDFDFTYTGVRVPMVAVNPRIPPATVIKDQTFEHASIAKTIRMQFARETHCLSAREDAAPDVLDVLPFTSKPHFRQLKLPAALGTVWGHRRQEQLNEFESSLLDLASAVRVFLSMRFIEPTTGEPPFIPRGPMHEAAQRRVIEPGSRAATDAEALIAEFHRDEGWMAPA